MQWHPTHLCWIDFEVFFKHELKSWFKSYLGGKCSKRCIFLIEIVERLVLCCSYPSTTSVKSSMLITCFFLMMTTTRCSCRRAPPPVVTFITITCMCFSINLHKGLLCCYATRNKRNLRWTKLYENSHYFKRPVTLKQKQSRIGTNSFKMTDAVNGFLIIVRRTNVRQQAEV